jgi:hypothetical protein
VDDALTAIPAANTTTAIPAIMFSPLISPPSAE